MCPTGLGERDLLNLLKTSRTGLAEGDSAKGTRRRDLLNGTGTAERVPTVERRPPEGQAASMTLPRIAAAHSTTNASYSSRSWGDSEPPARSHSARICSLTSAADRTEPEAMESGDMRPA
jgi:hypothetical protein